jgi:pSer/pThr/pTyr-binding forkhead associated (FHA) protein
MNEQAVTSDCRDCSKAMREYCIQQSNTSPSVKMMMRSAFAAGTDTQQMWGLLQMNCLLVRKEEPIASRSGSLMRRLHTEPGPLVAEAEVAEEVAGETEIVPPLAPTRPAPVPEPRTRPAPPAAQPAKVEEKRGRLLPLRYCLASRSSRHRIALPVDGKLVLGRFDPETDVTPDVDLSLEDRDYYISRRHARIVGGGGQHEIEDLGSTNGTTVNERRLGIGQRMPLQPGDLIALGHCEFLYNPIPEVSARGMPPAAYLMGTFTGHRFPLPSDGEVVVGRSDPLVGLPLDVDLGGEGEVAVVVARRHVKIIGQRGRHYVEDLGSAAGTKLNGVRLLIGEQSLLSPGDHLWLGGCVLAYDVEQS